MSTKLGAIRDLTNGRDLKSSSSSLRGDPGWQEVWKEGQWLPALVRTEQRIRKEQGPETSDSPLTLGHHWTCQSWQHPNRFHPISMDPCLGNKKPYLGRATLDCPSQSALCHSDSRKPLP